MTKAKKNRPTIQLWQSGGVGLVIPFESGVFYSNQTGGYGCLHPEEQGVYIPLVNDVVDQQDKLLEYFTGPKWQGWCNDGIDGETADFIDSVLVSSPYTTGIKVDRTRLADSHEAWVFVTLADKNQEGNLDWICTVPGNSGILTWENSD